MELQEYIRGAIRTESIKDHIDTNEQQLICLLKAYVAIGNMLDDIKKNVFYGKTINQDKWADNLSNGLTSLVDTADEIDQLTTDRININPRLFHAIIGIATESTELVEAILKAVENNEDIDSVNVCEELGDLNWYQAIAIDASQANWDNILETNLNKLKKRYPDKFTSEDAINRDLISERQILEGKQHFEVRTAQQVLDNLHDY